MFGLLAVAASTALLDITALGQAAPAVTITIDENGNGTLTDPAGAVIPIIGVLAPDPGPGGLPSTLTYTLPPPFFPLGSMVAGDVGLDDAAAGNPPLVLDLIRFNPAVPGAAATFDQIVFYSDNTDGVDALADTPSPPGALYPNNVTIPEIGPEGDNGATYTPTAGQPGFVEGFAVTYNFISDSEIPEATTPAIVGGLAILGLAAWRQRRKLAKTA